LFADFVFQSANFDFRTLDFTSDVNFADNAVGAILDSTNPDLRPFKAHGGKIIHYVGWADSAIATINSVNYYNDVTAQSRRNRPCQSRRNFSNRKMSVEKGASRAYASPRL
jgi:feruloyl esterase